MLHVCESEVRTQPRLEMRRTVSIMDTNERSREQRDEDKGKATVGFDFCVLGICCGNGLNQLNFALVRYRPHSPNASLRAKLLKVHLDIFS
jgi:hypothetical protein